MKKILAIVLVFILSIPTYAGVSSKVEGDTSNYVSKAEVEAYMRDLETLTKVELPKMISEYTEKKLNGSFERVIKKIATKSEIRESKNQR